MTPEEFFGGASDRIAAITTLITASVLAARIWARDDKGKQEEALRAHSAALRLLGVTEEEMDAAFDIMNKEMARQLFGERMN